jgi:hypothetical protein
LPSCLTSLQDTAREIFLAKQANERTEKWVMGNYMFFRMHRITDIYFVGGFGTVQWIDVNEYLTATPDAIATNSPAVTLQVGAAAAGTQFVLKPASKTNVTRCCKQSSVTADVFASSVAVI